LNNTYPIFILVVYHVNGFIPIVKSLIQYLDHETKITCNDVDDYFILEEILEVKPKIISLNDAKIEDLQLLVNLLVKNNIGVVKLNENLLTLSY
jgi:hypothetical protein